MAVWPSEYVDKVINDVAKYNNIRKTVKAGIIERCTVRYCSPEQLHPNPDDEFSKENIGPNFEIVGKYIDEIVYNQKHLLTIFKEPVIVQKMEPDGYMLINGHHRWFAALRMMVKRLHIKIINLVNVTDLNRMIDTTANDRLVSFDFDEVLLSPDKQEQAPISGSLFGNKFPQRLRIGAPDVIREFQSRGYDVCVYTSSYMNEEDFVDFFSMYNLNINIVVNGVNEKRKNTAEGSEHLIQLIRDKYKHIVHVDNTSVIFVDHITGSYNVHELPETGSSWADAVLSTLFEHV